MENMLQSAREGVVDNVLSLMRRMDISITSPIINDMGNIFAIIEGPCGYLLKVNCLSIAPRCVGIGLVETRLRTLSLTCVPLSLSAVQALSNHIQMLNELTLNHVGLNRAGIEAISNALPHTDITRLCLDDNCIGDIEAGIIARGLRESRGLNELSLCNNRITDLGADAIADALRHSSLHKLDLSDNAIGDDGVIAIATSALVHHRFELHIGNNDAGNRAAAFLIKELHDSSISRTNFYQGLCKMNTRLYVVIIRMCAPANPIACVWVINWAVGRGLILAMATSRYGRAGVKSELGNLPWDLLRLVDKMLF